MYIRQPHIPPLIKISQFPMIQPVWPKYSRGAAIVVQQTAESPLASHSRSEYCSRLVRGSEGQNIAFSLVITFGVVVHQELSQRPPERALPEQNQFGKVLLLDGSHPPFSERVEIRTTRR